MPNKVIYSKIFIKEAKELKKRHRSLVADLEKLEESLIKNPIQGTNLGAGIYKIRLAVQSKGKGKSGGYRVITFLITESETDFLINMVTIYDKADESNIPKKRLLDLIKELS